MKRLARICAVSLLMLAFSPAIMAQQPAEATTAPAGVQLLANQPYGPDARQRMDVYLPPNAKDAPVLVLVHGGAWMFGNKEAASVVNQKVAHWVRDQGFILVSVGYRFVPQVDVMQQAQDVARAVATAQASAPSWGGDAGRFVLMGHSAGAHLVALLSASPDIARQQGARPWLGAVALDSAALDTAALMQRRHMPFYDRVFGSDPAYWRTVSPTGTLARGAPPMLLVCSTQRRDGSCTQAREFAARIAAAGGRAEVAPEDLSHAQINAELGLPGAYTATVDAFIRSLPLRGAPGRG
ncbi:MULTISPECIES: alpha/beta hydrolase [unclassified Variovorax]|jgi:acetyl esterase/lipase|uniref:alpha/beta hydrolase n=1 Tax=unclassified Variovorax TaxID=663243 RepID=UPI000F7E34D7|nr:MULTISPECIES: alpha/beta hydrolase [unclassified Variovorax]RSZ30437.1 alpha/beta hydrolase [Variovorax sp. 553]RSZ30974.1 alpha/beta hydrolase [Variovorax sp. 679]